ncbi:hypothetical protein DERF_010274 [Dermatophagoides farinae]|uniref:Uncharacterized protein n=1 Tax=Dermatophagoides farinae TaxID=6954 RepID=A0A922HY31_DERFA|nr:hypothetical protein DERF_010274 [Dermatophagoides farinae]
MNDRKTNLTIPFCIEFNATICNVGITKRIRDRFAFAFFISSEYCFNVLRLPSRKFFNSFTVIFLTSANESVMLKSRSRRCCISTAAILSRPISPRHSSSGRLSMFKCTHNCLITSLSVSILFESCAYGTYDEKIPICCGKILSNTFKHECIRCIHKPINVFIIAFSELESKFSATMPTSPIGPN